MAEYSRVHVHPELFPMDVLAFSRSTSMREDPRSTRGSTRRETDTREREPWSKA